MPHTNWTGLGTCAKTATAEEIGLLLIKQYSISINAWHQVGGRGSFHIKHTVHSLLSKGNLRKAM
jgi:hypothetical protein